MVYKILIVSVLFEEKKIHERACNRRRRKRERVCVCVCA